MRTVLLKRKLTSFQIIILGFSGVILFGTFLLMLPFSSRSGLATPFSDALFTSTSAVCVTGLIIHDTATYWSAFGQFVILLLIQIGGMGVITIAASFAMISGRKISLMQRSTMQEAISAPKVGGIVRLTGFIVKVTLVMELLCAAVMAPVFCRDFGKKGLWMALFHSVSAFCRTPRTGRSPSRAASTASQNFLAPDSAGPSSSISRTSPSRSRRAAVPSVSNLSQE